jgi:hypothetical protein
MNFENASRQQSGRSIVLDFQLMNIHTGMYVRRGGKKPIEYSDGATLRAVIARGLLMESIRSDGTIDFHFVEGILYLS